jgi:hypothetical protein
MNSWIDMLLSSSSRISRASSLEVLNLKLKLLGGRLTQMRHLAQLDVGSPRVELRVLLKLGMLKPEVPSQQVLVGDTLYYQHVYQLSKGVLEHKEHGEAGQYIADHMADCEHL